MPLFEFFRSAKGKLEPIQEKKRTSCSADSPPVPENDFAELAWEDGQVLMQSQCNPRDRRSLSVNTNSLTAQSSKLGGGELSEFSSSVPPNEIGMNQEDNMVPWSNYPISGSSNNDYFPDFLSEFAGAAVNETSAGQNFPSVAKTGQNPLCKDSLFSSLQNVNGLEEPTRTRTGNTPCSSSLKLPRAECNIPISTSGVMNFSYFARPASIIRSHTWNGSEVAGFGVTAMERSRSSDVNATAGFPNALSSGQNAIAQQRVGSKLSEDKSLKERISARKNEAAVLEDAPKEDKFTNQSWHPSGAKGGSADGEKALEPVKTLEHAGGSSSICSGNSVERASDDEKHGLKRKSHETGSSEGHSEDAEEELVSAKKQNTAPDASLRRSRAAEVHNLSERRRRDRINEKMRALQELIPNSNKVDKASLLDEAIEYVKTLKLQLQMMSMGGGFYMAPMMMPHYPNIGMGMGRDFGMGIPHMNIHGPHFMPGMNPMAGSMYNLHGQGMLLPLPRQPLVPFSSGAAMRPYNAYGVQGQDPVIASSGKESIESTSKHSVQNTGPSCFTKQHPRSQSVVAPSSMQASDKKNTRGTADSTKQD